MSQIAAIRENVVVGELVAGCELRLASPERAAELLVKRDAYTAALGHFDLCARLGKPEGGTIDEYLARIESALMPWHPPEIEQMAQTCHRVRQRFEELGLNLPLPTVVEVVKSTLAEEGGMAGYTRDATIVLNRIKLDPRTFVHELHHVLTRHRPDLREKLHRILGFEPTHHLALPQPLADLRITNPDAPFNDAIVRLHLGKREVDAMLILIASGPYQGGPFPSYMREKVLLVGGPHEGRRPELMYGMPRIFDHDEFADLDQIVGTNTGYRLHPEEISAEHFVHLMVGSEGLPRPDLVDRMYQVLREAKH